MLVRYSVLALFVAASMAGSVSLTAQGPQPGIFVATGPSDSVMLPYPQDDPNVWALIQDSTYVYLRQGGDPIPAEWASAAFSFDMVSDSIFLTTYEFTECSHNGARIPLRHWKDRRVANANAVLLSFNSTTDTFTVHGGDTISFYRELYWKNLMTGEQDTAAYMALDSLDYAVELVRLSDSSRVALVDSIGLLANPTEAPPRIHGMYPLMACPRYVVDQTLNGTAVFLRLLVYHRGGGPYWFTRTDHITLGASQRLAEPMWQDFATVFQPAFARLTAPQLRGASSHPAGGQPYLGVVGSPSGELNITFDNEPAAGRTVVAVFDESGRHLYSPWITTGITGRSRAAYRTDGAGIYFVALLHNGRLVALRTVTR